MVSGFKCDECQFETNNQSKLKKHIKKRHEKPSRSNSPLKKKQKTVADFTEEIVNELIGQIHDRYESESEIDKDLEKLETVSFEERRVDEQMMDAKIEENKLGNIDGSNPAQNTTKLPNDGTKSQDDLKHKRENSHKAVPNARKAPEFKQIPTNLKKYFPNNHVVLTIKPDGLCGISCGSAHIFAQPQEAKYFRRAINLHLVSH